MRLGIDVGGTNTDAALMSGRHVVETIKRSTTENVGSGVVDAVSAILDKTGISPDDISNLMIGTTQFVNAFLQRRNMAAVAVIRICSPKADGVPPMVCWPEEVTSIIGQNVYLIEGGAFYTGAEYASLDEGKLEAVAKDIALKNIESVAISAVFSPIRRDIESRAAAIIAKHAPRALITKSADIGGIGLVDRENASIINASLAPFAKTIVSSMEEAFRSLGIKKSMLFSQNNGTLISSAQVRDFPIFTCSAGPTNSIRGAGFLTGSTDAIVVDVGGTTTDIGFLANGFPRETSGANYVGGVRTNFNMPDILSIALGGGTIISSHGSDPKVGPESVGFHLPREGLVFGGNTLTATDIAVAAGRAQIGERAKVAHLSAPFVESILIRIQTMVEDAIDLMRTTSKPIDVILVGGGAILFREEFKGAARVLRPDHADVANAVGAAIAQVSGATDKLYDFSDGGREAALARARQDAIDNAIAAGAAAESIDIVSIEELPMTHMQSSSVRVRVNAIGELA